MSPESKPLRDISRQPGGWVAGVACLLFFLSLWGAWNASRQTEYPPIHDVLSYTTKAENVWAELRQGKFTGLLGVEQTIRPFGTSLLGYPFGYDNDFRAFYWRTVAFPACFAALGAFFAALAAGASWKSPSAWLLACLAGMLPMWWAFDPVRIKDFSMCTISFWGMMDGMQAGVAALSTGLLLFGWRRNAAAATFASFFLSASTLLIKPVGVFLIFGHVLAASCLWVWSFRTGSAQGWKRFMVGVLAGGSWCALVMAWCWFSPYFSEANREMGRQALHQLKALALDDSAGSFILLLRSLGVYAIGPVSLLLWAYALLHFRRAVRIHPWSRILLAVTSLVLLLQLAALYLGTHFLTTRYFLPALAIFWIFLSPFLWTLLKESRVACALVLLNALVLSGSIWFPEFSNGWYSKTGYATFHDKQAVATFQLAKSALKKSNTVSEEPFIYIPADLNGYHLGLVSRQLIFAGGRQDKVVWPYGPRVWEKHEPVIHPHEISTADFLIMSSDPSEIRSNEGIQKFQIFSDLLQDNASYQTLAEDHGVMIRSVTDPIALEKAMAARLIAEGLLNPQESGPVRLEDSHSAPIAQWESGDELLFAKAEWVDGKLRIITRWSGTRREKRHLAISVALADSSGTQFHWITATLLPPPSFDDGKPYQRTIVDELDCGGFRGKTMAAAVGIYDRSAKTMIPVRSPAPLAGTDRIPVAITNSAP